MSSSPLLMEAGIRRTRLNAWVPVVFWLLVVALESTPMFGSDHTSGPLRWFCELFHGPYTELQWWWMHHDIRKTGHFFGYGILAALNFRACWMTLGLDRGFHARVLSAAAVGLGVSLFVASCDEFHQTFMPNRTGTPVDVVLDGGGSLAALLFCYIWVRRQRAKSQ